MGFIDEIKQNFPKDLPIIDCYRAVIFGDACAYFENVRGIKGFTPSEIRLFLKKGELLISGENLFIKRYFECDLVVQGKIKKIELL
jgi:sporulation protein YqfC